MLLKQYRRLLAGKLLVLLLGAGVLFNGWMTNRHSSMTGSVIFLIDRSAGFLMSPDQEDNTARLFQQTVDKLITTYPYSPIGAILASDKPTYLLPDTRHRERLATTLPLLLSLTPSTSSVDRERSLTYLADHAATGSLVYLLTDRELSPAPSTELSQHIRQKRLDIELLTLGTGPAPTAADREKQFTNKALLLSSPEEIQQLQTKLPGTIRAQSTRSSLLIAVLLVLLGL